MMKYGYYEFACPTCGSGAGESCRTIAKVSGQKTRVTDIHAARRSVWFTERQRELDAGVSR